MPIVFSAMRLSANGAVDGGAGGGLFQLIFMMVVMFGVLYFFMIRPENKRKKEAEAMRSALKKGDQITTIGGIMGKIVHVSEESIIIETSDDRVRMELAKWAVSVNHSQQPVDKKGKKAKEEASAQIEDGSDK